MRAAFIGCVQFSEAMLETLLLLPELEMCGIVTRKSSPANDDFVDLADIARRHALPFLHVSGNDQETITEWLAGLNIDVVFCLGWSYLLKPEVLALPARGVIGYHPTLLPRNRGRHPIIWALALGLQETGSTFFLMEEGADSGPILSQLRVTIDNEDNATSLYRRLVDVARRQLNMLVEEMLAGVSAPTPQDVEKASYWRKRGKADGCIDWRMPARGIHNLVRALTLPYPGAHTEHRGREIKIWKTRLSKESYRDVEPGRVLAVCGTEINVQCGDGAIVLEQHEFEVSGMNAVQQGDCL